MVGREDVERMKRTLDEMLERITDSKAMDNKFETIHQKITRLDERVRNIETLMETAVRLIQELIFISSGENFEVKEVQATVKNKEGEKKFNEEDLPKKINRVKVREEEVTGGGSWSLLSQRPKVSLHDLERELERLFSRMAELEIAREEKRITNSEYQMVIEALREKKEKITKDLDSLFNITQ
ncbi:MAG: hypothetical protein KIH08_06180 [Candidatus Freyarchaeota archaeon]|nr:hypothetical protein [Candidatus Jordarchaeia archaeon]MBS7268767.1 hypothetical protein [Candidatus Jordarchaeia archaeon]MBS7279596.1 hypothetical protein [Candidatus Jordarchaeia archaeon]